MIEYFVFCREKAEVFKEDLINLMEILLADNISQRYPNSLPAEYVKKMIAYIEDGSAFVVGAKDVNKLVGFCWAYTLDVFDEHRFHIDMICVDSKYRKMGVASHLVMMQKEEAKKRGIYVLEAMATRKNENSYNWFHSLGFEDERVKVKLDIE